MVVDIITAVAIATVPALATAIAVWVKNVIIPLIKAHTTKQQRENLMALVRMAVAATEQVFKVKQAETTEPLGTEKLAHAKGILFDNGVDITKAEIECMIEAAVLELTVKQDWGLTPTVNVNTLGGTVSTNTNSADKAVLYDE